MKLCFGRSGPGWGGARSAFRRVSGVLAAALLLLVPTLAGAAGAWQGTWQTEHGELRLIQQGARVFGDYADRGTLEARVSADGRTLRGAFNRHDGKWGLFDFRLEQSGRAWSGGWGWNVNTRVDDGSWGARLLSAAKPTLTEAVDAPIYWPIELYEAPPREFERFVAFADQRNGSTGMASRLTGNWVLMEVGRTVGTLEISSVNESVGEISGFARIWLSMGGTIADEGEVGTELLTRDTLVVILRNAESGAAYRIEMDRRGGNQDRLPGRIRYDDGSAAEVVLVREGAAAGPGAWEGEAEAAGDDEPFEGDLPGRGDLQIPVRAPGHS